MVIKKKETYFTQKGYKKKTNDELIILSKYKMRESDVINNF